ncbi:MAG: PAS domain-containing protein [Halorientalis sp.]
MSDAAPGRERRVEFLQRLHEDTRELMAAETVQGVAETAAELAQRHFEYATTGVRLLREDRLEMVAVATDRERLAEAKPPYEVGEGFVGRAFERGEAVVVDDLGAVDAPFDYDPMASAMVLPVEGWGTIAIAAGEAGAFDERDRELGRLFAADVRQAFELAAREQEVREQNRELEQYRTLVETLGDGVFMTDGQFRHTTVNDALTEVLGRDREDLLGARFCDIADEAAGAGARERYRRLTETDADVVTHDTTVQRPDGTTVPLEVRLSLLPDDEGTVGVVRDVSDRSDREQELRKTKERLRMAIEGADLGVWDWYVEEGRVTFNERWAEMLGYSLDELEESYETWANLVHPDDLDDAEAALKRHVEGETDYYRAEYRMRTKEGEWRWIRDLGRIFERDEGGTPLRAVGVHWDVTERRESERELQETKDRLELAFEGAELGLWDWNVPADEITINDRWAEMHGYDPGEVEDPYETWAEHVHPDDLEEAQTAVRRNVLGETEYYQVEYRMHTRDGEQRWMRDHGRVVERDEDGYAVRVIGVHWDVTERKEREQRLRRQRDELETLDRINELVQETIGALVSAASRSEIEATVCERLGGSSLYKFAAIGGRSPGNDYLEARETAGEGADYLEAVSIPADPEHEAAGPAAQALSTGDVVVTDDIADDPRFEPQRDAALEHGFRSLAAVPLTSGGVVHGVLGVFADRPDAFSERERQAFRVLGETVGFTISATQDRNLIEADTHVELALRLGGSPFLAALSERLEATCRLRGVATASTEGTVHYVAVEGGTAADADAVAACDGDRAAEVRHVTTGEEMAVFEVRLRDSLAGLVRESGAELVEAVAEDGAVDVVVEAPREVDLQALRERLAARHGDVTLVSKQEGDRSPAFDGTACGSLTERLTDRQEAALLAAYFGGYYDWPRESAAEDLADSLGVATPTFTQHLRHAHRKVVGAVLDADGGLPDGT